MVTRTAWLGFYALAKAKKVGICHPIEHALERELNHPDRVRQSSCRPQLAEWEGKSSAPLPPQKKPVLLTECVSVVAQIAKQQGLKVIGSAGSDEKVKYLKEELGLDAAFNYKTEDVRDVLEREGPIDIYWDHIGGKTLEAVIDNMNVLGRVIVCGFIEQYNSKDNTGFEVKNLSLVCLRQLSITGFFVGVLEKREGDFGFFEEAPKLVRDGKIKIREEVRHGLDSVPQFLLDILQGKNVGKAIVIVADE
ncbi:hypothetical protein FRC00_010885 [Tulasnella sp. 408]|nr:hypothetical protein FRC00_010885 [Tulasnella sp. 408]